MLAMIPCMVLYGAAVIVILLAMCSWREGTCKWQHHKLPVVARGSVTLHVNSSALLATTDKAFVCATLDWWPPGKCDYGNCPWDQASLLNLNLTNPLFEKALRELSPLRIRLGGTLQDQVVYKVGRPHQPCLPFVKNASHMFGFQGGCLSMARWTALNRLFQKTGTVVAFGLNALYNRKQVVRGVWNPWDSSNAWDFIKFTIDQGYKVQAWELGNELSGDGVGTSVSAERYAADLKELRKVISTLYRGTYPQPLVVAPDGFFHPQWYDAFLNALGPGVVDVITRHIYSLGPGVAPHLMERILNSTYLDMEKHNFLALQRIQQRSGLWAATWVGEAGGAYNSGQHLVTDAFVSSFWYLDQLAMAASFNNTVYCRQSFIGGYYGLLNTTTYEPNPDYYSVLLWNRLMGMKVLSTYFQGAPCLRGYAHCQRNTTTGGVTALLINLSNTTTYTLDISFYSSPFKQELSGKRKGLFSRLGGRNATSTTARLEYHLTAPGGNLHSQTVLLNGNALGLTPTGEFPDLPALQADSSTPISVAPYSIAFVVLPDAGISICT